MTTSCVHLHGACSVLCPPPVGVPGQLTRLNFDALPECVHAHRFVEEWDANNAPAAKDSASVQGSQITSSSRDSLYKHFDKLTPSDTYEDHLFREETKYNYRVRYAITQKARLLVQAFYRDLEKD